MNEYFVPIGQFLADKLPTSSATQTLQGLSANCSQFKLSAFIAKQLRSLKTNKSIGLDKMNARLLGTLTHISSKYVYPESFVAIHMVMRTSCCIIQIW